MCGFVGFVGGHYEDNSLILKKMTERIKHRGPDDEGYFQDDKIGMGFRRLSIIDLEEGKQPIYNENKNLVLTFNGEIYNYVLLREKLAKLGHKFITSCDSEVLIHGYEEYGVKILEKLRGMFAFAIWDRNKEELFFARDYFGIKPFYYGLFNDVFMYGSEIKSFLDNPDFKKELNEEALESYLSFQYSPLKETFFKNVFKLTPGHYGIYNKGEIQINRYFVSKFEIDNSLDFDTTVKKIDDVFTDSIRAHKIADVEVGSFLSSGIDSSYAAAKFNGDRTFTVGFSNAKYNEIEYAKNFSKVIGIKNTDKIITPEEYWDNFPKIQYHLDEPLADPSCVPLYFVSNIASKEVKVCLSGEGADELFGGYEIYREPISLSKYTKLPKSFRKMVGLIAKKLPKIKGRSFLMRGGLDLDERFIGNAYIFKEDEREKILKNPIRNRKNSEITSFARNIASEMDDTTKMQSVDINHWLIGDILLKADKMSMANSLEVRVPYLDIEVWKLANTLPLDFKVTKSETKRALRKAAISSLPPEVANKKKLGFPVPIRVWLTEDKYYEKVKSKVLKSEGNKYFNVDEIIKLMEDHRIGHTDNSRKIWTIYTFLVWYDIFFDK